ncbi:hypothetical protein NZ698_08245 [Chryseobacterium sp. PBS4-4]|uniref:Uncharacterized protein n=1 Tax=Chryseobacterium edaphi TaxID=2976532 RepID=A0ABT2W4P6_9FLAO|nr:hypothetical protein [Chryseobacterium edaphi]MCU7617185.1 hypothetical protein [Chryseobacterium edaphi]
MKYYNLHINCKNKETYKKITNLLGVKPIVFDESKHEEFETWTYQLTQKEKDKPIDFINMFLDILEPNFVALKKLDIEKSDILFWLVYEYKHQCNMEFHPKEMLRLGNSEICLNIDCFDENKVET